MGRAGTIRKVAVWVLVAVLLAGGGWWWWQRGRAAQTQPGFLTVPVRRGDLVLAVEGSGPVQPAVSTVVRTAVGGTVAGVLVKEGQRVRAGDVLVRLDDSSARTGLEQARLDLESAHLRLESMRRAPTEAELASARATLAAAEAQLAQRREERAALDHGADARPAQARAQAGPRRSGRALPRAASAEPAVPIARFRSSPARWSSGSSAPKSWNTTGRSAGS